MEKWYNILQASLIGIISAVAAYFDSTLSFLAALILSFLFNVIAGFRADEVRVRIVRIIPPKFLQNFNGNKLKDSLMELFLITFITYLMKGLIDLMQKQDLSAYAVQFLIAVAIYYYLRNGLRNLVKVYPKVKFIKLVYYLIAFKLKELIGGGLADLVDKAENDTNKKPL